MVQGLESQSERPPKLGDPRPVGIVQGIEQLFLEGHLPLRVGKTVRSERADGIQQNDGYRREIGVNRQRQGPAVQHQRWYGRQSQTPEKTGRFLEPHDPHVRLVIGRLANPS